MKTLGYTPFDCDNHYYEALDAFTRHVPKEWQIDRFHLMFILIIMRETATVSLKNL